jgi:hypothetical protein
MRNQTNKLDNILQYTITEIKVDWDSMGISAEENNERTKKLGVGYGWAFQNGKIYINSSEFGEDDEFVQLVFVNNKNQTLEELYGDFDNFGYTSGLLFTMFGLYVAEFNLEPLSDEMANSIYLNAIKFH